MYLKPHKAKPPLLFILLAVLAGVIVIGAVVAGILLWGGGSGDKPTEPPAPPSVTITEAPTPSPSPTELPSPTTAPPTEEPTETYAVIDTPSPEPSPVSTGSGIKYVALTFDDGPSQYTVRVLNALAENGAVATFFVTGDRVKDYKAILQRIYDDGHEIGNHGYDHKDITKKTLAEAQKSVDDTADAIEAICGYRPTIMRPPYGAINKTRAEELGIPQILWTIDTRDWESRNASSVIKEVKNNMHSNAVILMHDLYESTASAAETIIPWLKEQGYTFVTVSELLDIRRDEGKEVGIIYPVWG